MFDKYSKRNTKSMSNKRNCLKHLFLISLIILIFSSCSPSAYKPNETASVRIEAMSLSTASIVPGKPSPTKYTLELKPAEGKSIKPEPSTTSSFSIPEVPVGTYTVIVIAYDEEKEILKGETTLIVKPRSENKATVIMNYILDGTGILSVTIDWTELTANNQVYTAINDYKALGFRAVYAEGKQEGHSINGIEDPEHEDYISWVPSEDLTSGTFEYRVEGLEPTSGTAIVFQIYTKINGVDQLIAETFPTVMQIYDGLVSKPDQNEGQNFKLDANHIISYLENISEPKAAINADNPSTAIDITWKNPTSLETDNLPFYVLVTAIDNDEPSSTFSAKSETYETAGGEGSATIRGLAENHKYNIKFQVIGNEGYSNNTQLLTGVQPKIVVEKIEFVNTPNDSYTIGNSITIEGKISPDNASNKDYKITITDGAEFKKEIAVTASTTKEERTIEFETSGNYTITLTSDDNNSKTVSQNVKVKLATPANLKYQGEPNESGITITWDPVKSAEGYKVIKVINGSNSGEINNYTATTYKDTDVKSGYTYAYKVYAYRTDETLNSLPTEATETVNVSNADITIEFPEGTLDLTGIFEGLQDKTIRLGTEDKIELKIAKDFATGTTYEWILNGNFGKPILKGNFNDASFLTIDDDTEGLKKYPDNASNDLTLRVKDSSGKDLGSITGTFTVINNDSAGKLMEIKTPDDLTNNTVYYGAPIQLEAIFANENAAKPAVTWSSSNPVVMSVDETGLVTTHQKGEPVEITVTVNDTKEYKTITLTPYVKATEISFGVPKVKYLIKAKTGVEITNDDYLWEPFDMGLTITAANGIATSSEPKITYDTSIVSIDNSGIVTPLSCGSTNITVSIDGFEKSFVVNLHDFDIYAKGKTDPITGGPFVTDVRSSTELNISSENKADPITSFDYEWCLDSEHGKTENNSTVFNVTISGNNVNGTFRRNTDYTTKPTVTIFVSKEGTEFAKIWYKADY